MGWPSWVDEIARRYLADEASVFVVHGAVDEAIHVDPDSGEALDAARLLVRFLRRTREVVAVLRPGPPPARLDFAEFTDRGRFETLVRAADVFAGRALTAPETDPMGCLARIWRALGTVGTAQGYVVSDTERLLPAAKRHLDPVPSAPDLMLWPTHPTLRKSNNILVFLCRSLDGVRPDLLRSGAAIVAIAEGGSRALVRESAAAADAAPGEPADGVDAAEAEVDALLAAEAPAPATAAPPEPEPPPLHDQLAAELVEALARHGEEARPLKIPVMDALARVLAANAPSRFGPLGFGVDAEGGIVVEGDGADAFRELWRSDIALDACAGSILAKLPAGHAPGPGTPFDATGMKALVRRLERILARG